MSKTSPTMGFPEIAHIHPIVIKLSGFGDLVSSNMYVVGSRPFTLIDAAPKFPGSFEAVTSQMSQAGINLTDIERIIITHGHIDHYGLAKTISEAVPHPVECFVHEQDAWRLSSDYFKNNTWDNQSEQFALFTGIPQYAVDRVKKRSQFYKRFGDPLDNVQTMRDGDVFTCKDFELRVIHTPGHSPGSCCIYEPQSRVLFSGDHLIKHISPNPFHEINRSRLKDPGYQSLVAFDKSLEKVLNIQARFAFSGHGEYIDDIPAIVNTYRYHHRARMDKILEILCQKPGTIYSLLETIFPSLDQGEIYLAISEITVHLEVLINQGRAVLLEQGPPGIYGAA